MHAKREKLTNVIKVVREGNDFIRQICSAISFHFVMLKFSEDPGLFLFAMPLCSGRPLVPCTIPCYSNSRPDKPLDDASAELADSNYDAALQSPKREEVREEGIRHAILPNGRPIHPSIHREQSRTNERTEKSHAKCPKRSRSKIVKKKGKAKCGWPK
jgi:hypothetical protein